MACGEFRNTSAFDSIKSGHALPLRRRFRNDQYRHASDRDEVVTPLLLPTVCAERNGTPIIPSAICFRDGARAPFIGRLAVEQNALGRHPGFAQGFKRRLGRSSRRPTARRLQQVIDAGECARAFFSGLRGAIREERRPPRRGVFGWWDDLAEKRSPLVSDLTLSVPVDAEESFRREMLQLASQLGARTVRVVDEPVAAALGYGVNVERERTLLVVDWGGGTLDVAVVRTGAKTLQDGKAEVLAKSEAPLGGDDIDRWIVERFLIPVDRFVHDWEVDALWQAAAAKESASLHGRGLFQFRDQPSQILTRDDLRGLLDERCAYRTLEGALDRVFAQLQERGHGVSEIDEALLVGGSSLLPEVDERVRRRLPEARVGEWNPFAAVAVGACEFARGGRVPDLIHHDYALRLATADGHSVYYELLVPAGTAYPSPLAERSYVPDPSSPKEIVFDVCEICRLGYEAVPWAEEASGRRVWRPDDEVQQSRALVINEGNNVLRLPPSARSHRRLQASYRVDEERFLRWTVREGDRFLKRDAPLGRLR